MIMNKRTLLIYRAGGSAEGWRDRKLMPSGLLTKTLAEHSFCGDHHKLPEPGDRFTVLDSQDGSGQTTHAAKGDWVVARVVYYPRPNDDEPAIAICYCDYAPADQDWQPVKQGRSVPEMLAEVATIS
jgi:hypothetical protein